MKGFVQEFKEFIMRGNVMDMAVGVIVGGAFQSIVNSLVNDVIMPVVTKITGGIDFKNWFISLDGSHYATLAQAQEAGAATLNYGVFITAVIQFLIMAFVIFMLVKDMNTLHICFGGSVIHIHKKGCPVIRFKPNLQDSLLLISSA